MGDERTIAIWRRTLISGDGSPRRVRPTYYIVGRPTGRPADLVNQLSVGMQQNPEVYNKTNTTEDYAAGNRRINVAGT